MIKEPNGNELHEKIVQALLERDVEKAVKYITLDIEGNEVDGSIPIGSTIYNNYENGRDVVFFVLKKRVSGTKTLRLLK